MTVKVGDIERSLFERFPAEWAEPWDRVGLAAGNRDREVTRVLVTLDPTREAVERARQFGANVLVTHHPVSVGPVERILSGPGPSGVMFAALEAGIALVAAHTNLDRSPEGVRALAEALGLSPKSVVETSPQPMTRVTVYAPTMSADALVAAMSAAGAGRVGEYERCAFTSPGTGEFTPRRHSDPRIGEVGAHVRADEVRVEMVCGRDAARAVIAAARRVHPYSEPLLVAEDVEIARGAVGLGMACDEEPGMSIDALATRVRERLGASPRVWGDDHSRDAGTIVTASGSASSLLSAVVEAGGATLVCGEVRYHDALNAVSAGLVIIECGHDVSEWPLVAPLADAVRSITGIAGDSVLTDESCAAWWTA